MAPHYNRSSIFKVTAFRDSSYQLFLYVKRLENNGLYMFDSSHRCFWNRTLLTIFSVHTPLPRLVCIGSWTMTLAAGGTGLGPMIVEMT